MMDRIADFFMILLLLRSASLNFHNYIQKNKTEEHGWISLFGGMVASFSALYVLLWQVGDFL